METPAMTSLGDALISTEEVNSSQKQRKDKKKKVKKQSKAVEQNPHSSQDNSSLKTDAIIEEVNPSLGEAVENKNTDLYFSADNSSLKTGSITEDVNSSLERKRARKKKKQNEAVEHKDRGSCFSLDNSSLKTDATTEEISSSLKREKAKKMKIDANSSLKVDATTAEVNSPRKRERERQKEKHYELVEHKDKGLYVSLDNYSLKTDGTTEEENSLLKQEKTKKKKKEGKAVEHIDQGPYLSAANSPLKIDATIEDVNSLGKWERATKKKKQGKTVECNDKAPNCSLDNSSLKIDAAAEEVGSLQKRKRERKEKKHELIEHEDKGPHVSLDNSSLKIDATTEEVNSSPKQERTKKKKKGKAVEHIDQGPYLSATNSAQKIDATIEEVNSLQKRERATKKKKQGNTVECNDKVPNFSQDNSSLKIDATTEEVSSPWKQKRERKEKQHKSVEHKDKGLHVSPDNYSLKIDATTEEVNISPKQKRAKKMKDSKAVEQIDQGPYLLATNSPRKIDATIEEVNSPWKLKSERKKGKQVKSVEHEEEGPHVSLDNSSLKTDATKEEVNSSEKRKREKKKRKQGKAIEHEDNAPHFSVDNSSQKTDTTMEDPLHESPALPTLLSSQRIVELSSTKTMPCLTMLGWPHGSDETIVSCPVIDHVVCPPKKKNKKKRRKTKHDGIENIVNCWGAPNDKTSTFELHMPSEHPIQFLSTDPLARQSCVEIDICQGEKEENTQCVPIKAAERSNGECRIQEVSCSRNSVISNVVCSAKETTLGAVKFNICREEPEAKEQCVPKKAVESSNRECHGQKVSCSRSSVISNAECSAKEITLEGVKFNICLEENEAKEQGVPKRVAESSNREFHVQEVSCSHNSVVSNAECSANACVSEVVKLNKEQDIINYSSYHKGNNDFVPNATLAKNHDDYGRNGCYTSPLGRTISCNSKKKLLILDVNGLLADFVNSVPKGSNPPDFWLNTKRVYKRPFCSDFLHFCFQRFHVGVWSSRAQGNLNKAIRYLFGRSASKLLFAWSRNQCTLTKYKTLEDKHKPLVLKELRMLWGKELPSRLPWVKGRFNESNTLLLDDSPYKALLNPRYTAIFPHSYHYDNPDDKSLGRGGDIRVYLEGLAKAENVQEYVSSNPFGQEAITETNPSWDFYSEVIEAVKHDRFAAKMPATSTKPKGCRQSSTTTDQVTTGLPSSATRDRPEQTKAAPCPGAGDPPQHTEAAPCPGAGDPPQHTEAAPPSGTGDPQKQIKAVPPPAMGDPPQQTEAPQPPTTEDPPQLTDALPSPATRDLAQQIKVTTCPSTGDPPQQDNAVPPSATGDLP